MSTTTPTPTPPAGWYPHPQGVAAMEMYWDGASWQETMVREDRVLPPPRVDSFAPRKRVNHILHAILTIFTGVWGFVWLALVLRNRNI